MLKGTTTPPAHNINDTLVTISKWPSEIREGESHERLSAVSARHLLTLLIIFLEMFAVNSSEIMECSKIYAVKKFMI